MAPNRYPTSRLQPGTVITFSLSPRGLRELFDDNPRAVGAVRRYFGGLPNQAGALYVGIVRTCAIYDPLGLVSDGEWKFSRPPPEEVLVECLDHVGGPFAKRVADRHPAFRFITHNIHLQSGPTILKSLDELMPIENLDLVDLNCCPLNAWPANYRQPLEATDPLAGLLPIMDVWIGTPSQIRGRLSTSLHLKAEWTTLKLVISSCFDVNSSGIPREASQWNDSLPQTKVGSPHNVQDTSSGSLTNVPVTISVGFAITAALIWSKLILRS